MPSHVMVNSLGLTYKSTVGISSATIPDVCKTPSPAGPVPIPYPNIASQSSLKGGTSTVKAKGKMIAVKGSQYGRSNGDEPGTAGGVKSGVNMKATDWITYSFNVKLEGKNACRHTDKKFHNNKNTVDLAGNMEPVMPAGLSPEDRELWEKCREERKKYKKLQSEESKHKRAEFDALSIKVNDKIATAAEVTSLFKICFEKALLAEDVIEGRIKYVRMECDKFDWFNKGTTASARRAGHETEIKSAQRHLAKLKSMVKDL